jgi:chorismate mutase / prephenate dehydratase
LSQCRNWLAQNVPQAELVAVASTAEAARIVQESKDAAAVASREAAIRYGLPILFSNIEDSAHNQTRFAVIGPHDSGRTGSDKTAMMFRIPHSPGSLADLLGVFKQYKVNLTWIESFPTPEAKGEYTFFAECEGHADDAKVKKTLAALQQQSDSLVVMGSFGAAPLID